VNFRAIKVYEDVQFLAFMDIQPVNKGHVLIVPKQHRALMGEMDAAALGGLFPLANRINHAIWNTPPRLSLDHA
jgi:histidine triad (HIT) family protein